MATVNYNGNTYRSIKQVPRQPGITYFAVIKRLQAGWTLAQSVGDDGRAFVDTRAKPVAYKGITYPSLTALVNAHRHTSIATIIRRLQKGWTIDEAMEQPPEDYKKGGIIYCISCLETGKSYIGLTTTSIKRRWFSHLQKSRKEQFAEDSLHSDIKKYGESSFNISVVDDAENLEVLREKELAWIAKLGTDRGGYNLTKGGETSRGIGIRTSLDGKEYLSMKDAAKALAEREGITIHAAEWRLSRGKLVYPKRHGMKNTKIYSKWQKAISGRKDVEVCEKWLKFEGFFDDMGSSYREGLCLSRIDTSKGFYPENCDWATKQEFYKRRKINIKIEVEGKSFNSISEACRFFNVVLPTTAIGRIKDGWDATKAVTTPSRMKG